MLPSYVSVPIDKKRIKVLLSDIVIPASIEAEWGEQFPYQQSDIQRVSFNSLIFKGVSLYEEVSRKVQKTQNSPFGKPLGLKGQKPMKI
jgi:hypothetical protein